MRSTAISPHKRSAFTASGGFFSPVTTHRHPLHRLGIFNLLKTRRRTEHVLAALRISFPRFFWIAVQEKSSYRSAVCARGCEADQNWNRITTTTDLVWSGLLRCVADAALENVIANQMWKQNQKPKKMDGAKGVCSFWSILTIGLITAPCVRPLTTCPCTETVGTFLLFRTKHLVAFHQFHHIVCLDISIFNSLIVDKIVHASRISLRSSTFFFNFSVPCCRFSFVQMSVITSDQFKLKHHKSIYSSSNSSSSSGRAAMATLLAALYRYAIPTMPYNVRDEHSIHVIAERKSSSMDLNIWAFDSFGSIDGSRIIIIIFSAHLWHKSILVLSTRYPQSMGIKQHKYSAFSSAAINRHSRDKIKFYAIQCGDSVWVRADVMSQPPDEVKIIEIYRNDCSWYHTLSGCAGTFFLTSASDSKSNWFDGNVHKFAAIYCCDFDFNYVCCAINIDAHRMEYFVLFATKKNENKNPLQLFTIYFDRDMIMSLDSIQLRVRYLFLSGDIYSVRCAASLLIFHNTLVLASRKLFQKKHSHNSGFCFV